MIYLLLILITFIHGDVITRTLFIYFNYGPVYYNLFLLSFVYLKIKNNSD